MGKGAPADRVVLPRSFPRSPNIATLSPFTDGTLVTRCISMLGTSHQHSSPLCCWEEGEGGCRKAVTAAWGAALRHLCGPAPSQHGHSGDVVGAGQ